MTDRRAKTPREASLDELAIAIAESSIDAWLEGEFANDGLEKHNDKGTEHESAETKAPATRRQRVTATKGLPNVRRSRR